MAYFGMSCGAVSQGPDPHPSSHGPKNGILNHPWLTDHCALHACQ